MNDTLLKKYYNAKSLMLRRYSKYRVFPNDKLQRGGSYPENVKIKIKNFTYKFVYEKSDREGEHFYMLYDSKDNERCVMIIIDENEKNALIDNINDDYTYCPNGSKLLDASINFLKEYKKILKIKRIVLIDNSMKKYFGNSIIFSDMYTLLYGITWYSSRGFLPYDQSEKNVDKVLLKVMADNKKIIENTFVKDLTNLEDILIKHGKIKKVNAEKVIDKYKDKKLYKFIGSMLENYENKEMCMLFYNIYKYIMYELGMQSMYGKIFFMKL
jgi:hypothetical protein